MNTAQQAPDIDAIMTQAQVFASAWALVGSRFDNGNEMANAEEQRSQLRTMLANAIPDSYASKAQPVNQQMLAVLIELRECAEYWSDYDVPLGIHERIQAAIAATEAAQPVCQHRIADARNPVVRSGYLCVDCGALFSAADHGESHKPANAQSPAVTVPEWLTFDRLVDTLAIFVSGAAKNPSRDHLTADDWADTLNYMASQGGMFNALAAVRGMLAAAQKGGAV